MIKVIKNGTVVTMDKNRNIGQFDIVITDNIISDIVINYEGHYDEIIDASNMIVMPGLINTHAHMSMSLFRGTNDGLDLMHWLNDKIFPIEDMMSSKDMYYGALLTCIEMIKTGSTCCNDMYFGCDEVIKALEETKIRCLYSRCINDPDGNCDRRIDEFEKLVEYVNESKNDLITLSVSPHSLYTCSMDCLKKCKDLSDKYDLPIHIHFCENRNEVDTIEKKFGMKPVKVLESLGYLNNHLILAHGNFIEEENLHLLSRDNIYISHNIVSNLNLGCGIFPFKKYIDSDLNVCLGTDGQGSGETVDLFNSMQITSLVTKGYNEDPLNTNSYDILESATINAARALKLDDKIGSIEVGKCADLIVLDLNDIIMYPNNNLINQLVHNVKPSNIKYSMVNGNLLLDDGELVLGIDENMLKDKINEIVNRLGLVEKH